MYSAWKITMKMCGLNQNSYIILIKCMVLYLGGAVFDLTALKVRNCTL